MDQPPPTSSEPPSRTTAPLPPPAAASPQQPPSQPQSQSQPQLPHPPFTTATSSSSQSPSSINPNPSPKPPNSPISSQPLPPQPQNPIIRTPSNRPWPPNPSPFPHFSSISNHSTAPSSSSITPSPRTGGMGIGVPAPHPTTSFSSPTPPSFSTTNPQVRQSISGMMGSLGSGSSLRPSGVAASLPQRHLQSSLRPPTGANNQSPATQNLQEHGHPRLPSVGSPGSPAPTTLQSPQSHNQPWLSSGSQGKSPLPPSFRPPMNPQALQPRSLLPSQQQPAMSASTQPSSFSQQPQEHYSLPPSRVPQTLTHQQQMARNRGLGNQRPFTPSMGPPSSVTPPAAVQPTESCNRIISKRSIQEIVAQIDPTERLDLEVEDILVDVADEFVESVTTFACSLAKHRKSNTLESKDILLHLERNWNMSLPGFGGDEIKCYKKPFGNDVHRERLAAIKRSIAATETPNTKSSGGQASGGAKGHPAKAPGLVISSPNPKACEAT